MGSDASRFSLTSTIDISCKELMWNRRQVYQLYKEYEKLLIKHKMEGRMITYDIFKEYLGKIGIKFTGPRATDMEKMLKRFYIVHLCRDKNGFIGFKEFSKGIGYLLSTNNDEIIKIAYYLWNQGQDDNFDFNLLLKYLKKLKLKNFLKFMYMNIDGKSTLSYDDYHIIIKKYQIVAK